MDNDGKDTKFTKHIQEDNFCKKWWKLNLHNTVCCERGLQLAYIGTKNVKEDELNPRLNILW